MVRDNPRFPNDVKMLPIHNRVIRYHLQGVATADGITPGQILRSVGSITNASATYVPIFGAIRIRRLSFYFVPSTLDLGSVSSEIVFSWTGVQNAPDNLITDRGTNSMPACIKVVPPHDSIASMWFDTNSPTVASNIFVFTAPIKTIVDIDFDFILANGAAPSSLTLSGASTVTGLAYIALNWGSSQMSPDAVALYHQ